jgi:hypothetical protein
MALLLVGERVIEARNAVDEHMASGLPATGPLWDAKTTAYRTAWARFEADVMAMRRKVTS